MANRQLSTIVETNVLNLFKSSEVKENEGMSNKEPFRKYLVHIAHETSTGNVDYKFDFDLYKEKNQQKKLRLRLK